MMPMRRIAVLIIIIVIIGSLPPTTGRAVKNPTQRDVFLYEYFSQVLTRFEYSLKYAVLNESYSTTLAQETLQELELLHQESLYYQERGVNATVMRVLPPFYEFSKQLVVLTNLMLKFQSTKDPALAAGILGTVEKMESLLDSIEAMKLRNGEEVLVFDTSGVRKRLNEIKAMISTMQRTGKYNGVEVPKIRELTLRVSDGNPIINETVTIFGTAPLNETVTITITKGDLIVILPVTPSNGFFSTTYRFEKLGVYEVYATQGNETSNTVNVTVRKIPTLFVVDGTYSAFINRTIELRGKLVDYYGRFLGGRNVSIGNSTVVTGPDGGFSRRYFSDRAKTIEVTLTFTGDEIHEGTSKTVTLIFKKYPVSISLEGPSEITLGENATFEGTVTPSLEAPLDVYINGSPAFKVTPSNGTFSFTIKPKEAGSLRIHVEYPGSEFYEGASSNVLVLTVIPQESMFPRYIAIALLAVALMATAIVMRRRRETGSVATVEEVTPVEQADLVEETIQVPADVGEAYKLLRAKLKEMFGISESLTPREALKTLSEWELYPVLERVTLLHEKAVYGSVKLSEEELREFREAVERLSRGGGE